MMKLTIAIPTIVGREKQFMKLMTELEYQILLRDDVEIISLCDNKEMSIGTKRQKLYEMAKGRWTIQVDDDDSLADDYVEQIIPALANDPDCIGYVEDCDIDGKKQLSSISKTYKEWKTIGNKHERTPYFKVPIKTELCLKAGVTDMRFGEDHDFAKRIHKMIKTEVYLDIPMYYYKRITKRGETHESRYGIK